MNGVASRRPAAVEPALRCALRAAQTLKTGNTDRRLREASIWLRRAAELLLMARGAAMLPAERARLAALDAILRDVSTGQGGRGLSKRAATAPR